MSTSVQPIITFNNRFKPMLVLMALVMGGVELHSQELQRVNELSIVWEYPTPREMPLRVIVDAQGRPYLYVAMKNGGLAVLDNTNPHRAPTEVARLTVAKFDNLHVMHVTQSGQRLFLALGDFFDANGSPAGLAIVDVKEPRHPRIAARWKSDEVLQGSATVLLDGGFAYLGAMSAGVMIFDVSQPNEIKRLSVFQPDIHFPTPNPKKVHHPNARGLAKRKELLFVAYDAGGLRVVDVSNRREPREISRFINSKLRNKPQAYNDLVVDGNRGYVAIDYAGLEILDIANPREIRQLGWWNPWRAETLGNLWFNSPGHTNQIAWDKRKKRVWLSAGDSELQVVDISNVGQLKLVAGFGAPKNKLGTWGMTLAGDVAYLTYINAVVPFNSTWSGIKAVK